MNSPSSTWNLTGFSPATTVVGHSTPGTSYRCAFLAVFLLLLGNLLQVEADPDLWGHLQFGLTHLQSGQLAQVDPYSYTAQGHVWTNHEWLTEWSFAVCYRAAGAAGLMVLRGMLLITTVVALGIVVRRRGVSPGAMLGIGLVGITILAGLFRVRPQMFTYALMALLILVCDTYTCGSRKVLWWVPLIIAVWTNFHAGFVAGLCIFGVYWLGMLYHAWRGGERRQILALVSVMALSLAATLLNPYGLDYWKYVVFAVRMPRPEIVEWQPILTHNGILQGLYFGLVLIPLLIWFRGGRKGPWAEVAIFVLGAWMTAKHGRHLAFLTLFATVFVARHLPAFSDRLWGGVGEGRRRPHPAASLGWVLLLLLSCVGGVAKITRGVSAMEAQGSLYVSATQYPVQAVDFLLRNQIRGNLDCGFAWGEYCLFKLHPECHVFCDGRYETVYPHRISQLALNKSGDPQLWAERVRSYPTDVILAPREDGFAQWVLSQGGFVEIYADETARVLVRRVAGHESLIEAAREGRLLPPRRPRRAQPFPA